MDTLNNAKFVSAVRYIYDHLDEPLDLEKIALSVDLSVSTLKRIFQEVTEQSPGAFIRKLRMELAFKSLQSRKENILEVALASGFQDHSAFSRSFKEAFGYPPTQARQKHNIVHELESVTLGEPDLVDLVAIDIQSVTKQGLYYECAPSAWEFLRAKLTSAELNDEFSGLYIGVGHDNPHDGETKEDQVRFTAGVSLVERQLNLDRMTLPGGRYARFRYLGKPVNLGMAYHFIFGKWAQDSKATLRNDGLTFLVFDSFPNGMKNQSIMIHVPIC